MFLFWIAGFMFSIGFLNKCSGSENCLSKLATIETLKLFFIWPFVLGMHCSKKICSEKDSACCSTTEDQTDQAYAQDISEPVTDVEETVNEIEEEVEAGTDSWKNKDT